MPANENIAPIQQSGSANVPITESTAGNYQGTQGSMGNIENSAFSGTVGSFPEVFSNAIVASGNLTTSNQLIINSNFLSGVATVGLVIAGGSNASGYIANVNSGSPSLVGPAVVTSGAATVTGTATNSGLGGTSTAAPTGFFFINVPTSGSPWVKVPFYNS